MQRNADTNFDFQTQGMFDNIDQMEMEIDIYDADYQKFISDSLTI